MSKKLFVWGNHYIQTDGFQRELTLYAEKFTYLEPPIFLHAETLSKDEVHRLCQQLINIPSILVILIGDSEIENHRPIYSIVNLFTYLYDKLITFHLIDLITCGFIQGKQPSVFRQSRFQAADLSLLPFSSTAGTHLLLNRILTSPDFESENCLNSGGENKLALTLIRHLICYFPYLAKS